MSMDLADALAQTGDARPWVVGLVLSVDDTNARLTVSIDGSAVTLRRVAATYRVGDPVAVVRDPSRTGAGQYVAGVLGPVAAPVPLWRRGTVTVIDVPNSRLTVTVNGVSKVLPHVAGTYTVSGVVAVLLDEAYAPGGIVLGPLGNPPTPPPVTPPPPAAPATPVAPPVAPPAPPVVTVGTFEALILPTWSGTWSTKWSKWNAWQATRSEYGGAATLYQGDKYGSGVLTGVAVYGDQVAGLGATSITSMTVEVALATYDTGTPILQGAPTGDAYPSGLSPSGATVSGFGLVDLVASGIAEAMRTGAVKGLCAVGSNYLGLSGTSRNGMALRVTYTRPI